MVEQPPSADPPGQLVPLPPHFSADGKFFWDGSSWQPANPVPVRLMNPFNVGFFAFLGAFVASLVFWGILLVGLLVLGAIGRSVATP